MMQFSILRSLFLSLIFTLEMPSTHLRAWDGDQLVTYIYMSDHWQRLRDVNCPLTITNTLRVGGDLKRMNNTQICKSIHKEM